MHGRKKIVYMHTYVYIFFPKGVLASCLENDINQDQLFPRLLQYISSPAVAV